MEWNFKQNPPSPYFNALEDSTRILAKSVKRLKHAQRAWDFHSIDQTKEIFQDMLRNIEQSWSSLQPDLDGEIGLHKGYLMTENYRKDLEQELTNAKIPFQGEFPDYYFPPFHLHIDLDNYRVFLVLGRKSQRFSILQPQELAFTIANEYKAVYNRRFNSRTFLKDLLNAYKLANNLTYKQPEVLWGKAASLDIIYDLLTVRHTTHQEYPKILFQFELGLLKEKFDLNLEGGYKFEFGFTRNTRSAMVIIDSQGRESRISTLTVHKEDQPDVN